MKQLSTVTLSPNNSENGNDLGQLCPPSVAAERASLLLRQYPERTVSDPQVFIAGICAVFIRYPEMIVRRVTAPGTGIASKVEFISQAAVEKACDYEMEPINREAARRSRFQQSAHLLAGPKLERPSIEEIKEKLGPDYGITRSVTKSTTPPKSLAELQAETADLDLRASPELCRLMDEKDSQERNCTGNP